MDIPARLYAFPQSAHGESEALYKTLFETSNDAIMLLDEKRFFDCNGATLKVFGYKTKEEFCGKTFAEHSPPTQPDGGDSTQKANQEIQKANDLGKNGPPR